MKPPSEYIAPFDEDRQTGLVQTLPAGGVVAVGVGLAVAVGDTVALEDAVGDWEVEAEPDDEAEAEWLAELDDEAEAEWLAELDDEAEAEWLAELDDEAEGDVEAVLEVDADGGFVAVAKAEPLVVAVGAGVTPSLSTVKAARRLEVLPPRQVKTILIVCDPSTSFVVSYGRAAPSVAVPARSNGGTHSVRVGVLLRHPLSR